MPAGTKAIKFEMVRTGKTEGHLTLWANGAEMATGKLTQLGQRLPTHETFDVGSDWGSPVTPEYTVVDEKPWEAIDEVIIKIQLPQH